MVKFNPSARRVSYARLHTPTNRRASRYGVLIYSCSTCIAPTSWPAGSYGLYCLSHLSCKPIQAPVFRWVSASSMTCPREGSDQNQHQVCKHA